ncbi:ABC transporter substrate-binding protein [Paracoccus suum]|uniref:ABC transporter substrate-binding protein n=1 Tax=Paracoccus suum TaxID=2259340 RepID=A0A344PMK9_9RHOB|nr:ABC transporter substrate-binding protein [Paracoccus suum]AXC50614.1 ABC transporter substrate-binding protein [Paracoccus suum]
MTKLWIGAALAAAMLGTPAMAAKVTVAVGGQTCLCYLPAVLTEALGNFDKHGVEVDLVDFKGGSQALKAVVGGSADVVSGYFDHTVTMAAKHQPMTAFVVQDRYPGLVLAVAPKAKDQINTAADLAGKTVGVSAPGSSTDYFLKYMLGKNGLPRDAASVVGVGVGATAVAAMEQGQIDAAVLLDPAVTMVQASYPDMKVLVDTRNQADTNSLFGGDYPGGVLYAPADWVKSNPDTVKAMAAAVVETLQWIKDHSAEEIADKMPAEVVGSDRAAYVKALEASRAIFSETGIMDPKGAEAVLTVFAEGDPSIAAAKIEVSTAYDNSYAEAAATK